MLYSITKCFDLHETKTEENERKERREKKKKKKEKEKKKEEKKKRKKKKTCLAAKEPIAIDTIMSSLEKV